MYAIIRTGGKQYKVAEKTVLTVEKLDVEDGTTVELTDVLLVAGDDGIKIGTPCVPGASVKATVLGTSKGTKVNGYTYKPTKRVQRHYGHRQWHTSLRVDSITA